MDPGGPRDLDSCLPLSPAGSFCPVPVLFLSCLCFFSLRGPALIAPVR